MLVSGGVCVADVRVWGLPGRIGGPLRGAAVVVDLLRASTTIVRALEAGAVRVVPVLEPERAMERRGPGVRLGGERGGVLIPGFDLGNTPSEYTRESIGGKTLVFTTTNGTRAIEAARRAGAAPVVVGCLNNLSAVVARAAGSTAVHVVCAGTGGVETAEDLLCAGAMAARLVENGWNPSDDDDTRRALAAWEQVSGSAEPERALVRALRESRGGKNLIELGLGADIDDCARIDVCDAVPVLMDDGTLRKDGQA